MATLFRMVFDLEYSVILSNVFFSQNCRCPAPNEIVMNSPGFARQQHLSKHANWIQFTSAALFSIQILMKWWCSVRPLICHQLHWSITATQFDPIGSLAPSTIHTRAISAHAFLSQCLRITNHYCTVSTEANPTVHLTIYALHKIFTVLSVASVGRGECIQRKTLNRESHCAA